MHLPHPQIFSAVEPGHALLLDDGKIRMRVIEATANSIAAEVLVGGALSSRKGISLPDTLLPVGPLTTKDRADLAHLLKIGVDWIALSFLQRGADVHDVRKLVGDRAAILAKIEKPSAITDLDAIMAPPTGSSSRNGSIHAALRGKFHLGQRRFTAPQQRPPAVEKSSGSATSSSPCTQRASRGTVNLSPVAAGVSECSAIAAKSGSSCGCSSGA